MGSGCERNFLFVLFVRRSLAHRIEGQQSSALQRRLDQPRESATKYSLVRHQTNQPPPPPDANRAAAATDAASFGSFAHPRPAHRLGHPLVQPSTCRLCCRSSIA